MAKKGKIARMPKWAWWGLWLLGVLGTIFIILYGSFQIWLSTWKTFVINNLIVKVPSGWDVRDASNDLYKGQFAPGVVTWVKIGDSLTVNVQGPDDTAKYSGNVLIYVFKDFNKGDFFTMAETLGDNSLKTSAYKIIGNLITLEIKFPTK